MGLKVQQRSFGHVQILIGSLLLVMVLATSGCEPLRKKFVRKKKKDTESTKFIPVLDPVDYPDKVETAEQMYGQYFSLWQVWDKDLLMRIEEKASDKKINFTVTQVLIQLEEMEKLVTGDKQKQLGGYIEQVKAVQSDLAQPAPIRNDGVILRRLQRIGRDLREGFRVKHVEESLIK